MTLRQLLHNRAIRDYLLARVSNSAGRGVELSIMVIFVVKVLGLSAQQVGIATSAAAVTGLLVSFPAGIVSDRIGAKKMLLLLSAVQVASLLAFSLVFNFAAYLVAVCVFAAGYTAANPVSQALAGQITDNTTRAPAMAAIRAAVNLGIAVGSVIAVAYLSTLNPLIGRVSLALAAALMAVSLVFYQRLPADAILTPITLSQTLSAAKDWRYGILAGLMAPNLMVFQILTIGVPLWVTFRGGMPAWLVAAATFLNTLVIVALQFPIGGRISTLRTARTTLTFVGLGLALTCIFMALGLRFASVVAAGACVLIAVVALSLAEILETSARWELSYTLAPAATRTTHLSLFSTAASFAEIAGPLVLSTWVISSGSTGWLLLGGALLVIGLAQTLYATWLIHRRLVA